MAGEVIVGFYENVKKYFILPSHLQVQPASQSPMARVTPCLLPIKLKGKNEGLVSSLKMPYCEKMVDEMSCCKMVDEMLLGLLSDAEELCFPEFEILDDVENCDLMVLEKCTEVCGYMELIDLNGKFHSSKTKVKADEIEKGH
jgi:hypothetical protein